VSFVASPAVRAYATEKGVDLFAVSAASGRRTLSREDVDQYLSGDSLVASVRSNHSRYWDTDHGKFGPVTREPMPRVARIAAANLSAANAEIPQVTHHDRADMRGIDAFRKSLADEAAARGVKLTALAFHVKALARCLVEFPRFNSSLTADGETLIFKHYVHVGIAVDTPHALMVPVIRDADRRGLWRIAAEIADLSSRAQSRKISSEEMGGASMSISNLGSIGGNAFTPIVNPPEVAILGLSRTETVPIWAEGEWLPVPMVPLDLSYDHRVINGADAARFITRYAALLADPRRMLI
jgi:pyruvate/2-oxoglutarate dehydrogenase complex dihydrolipoamide acyltransferase (E2) component